MQDVLTDWDGTDIGYTWDVENGNDILLSFVVIVTTPLIVILVIVLYVTLSNELKETTYLFLFLYSLEIPAGILILVEFITSFILFVECQSFSCFIKASTAIVIFISAVVITVVTIARLRKKSGYDLLQNFFAEFIFLKALIALTSISFIPLILLIVVYPAEILCTLIIYLSVMTMSTIVLYSPVFLSWCYHKRNEADTKDKTKIALLVLAVFFNISLAAMLLCLLYMQALLAGATSNTVVKFILVLVTGLIPGGLVVITGRAIKKEFHVGDTVFLIQPKKGSETFGEKTGPYKLKAKVGKKRFLIDTETAKNLIVSVDDLLNKPESDNSSMLPLIAPTDNSQPQISPQSTSSERQADSQLLELPESGMFQPRAEQEPEPTSHRSSQHSLPSSTEDGIQSWVPPA